MSTQAAPITIWLLFMSRFELPCPEVLLGPTDWSMSWWHVQGTLTLLLGPPGSGKTTLLKALAGKLRSSSSLTVSCLLKLVPPRETDVSLIQAQIAIAGQQKLFSKSPSA